MVTYAEGDWFAIPLQDSRYALGLVGRCTARGPALLAYCFGPALSDVPKSCDLRLSSLRPADAIKVARVADLYLRSGRWPIVEHQPDFDRGRWSFPSFVRVEPISGRSWLVLYSDRNPGKVVSETQASVGTVGERDMAFGAGAFEVEISKLLAATAPR